MNETNNFALVPKPTTAVEKSAPGAKPILSGMVAEVLGLAKQAASKEVAGVDAELESWCQKGESYAYGRGVPMSEPEAAKWFRMAAERGHARAQCWLASFCLWNPRGRLQAYLEAEKWLRKAAEQGFDHGQNQLGQLYRTGLGIPRDDSEAARWFLKAASQGHPCGQLNLGQCYRDGRGVARDCCESFKWFKLAANNAAGEAHKWFDLPDPRPAQLGRENAAKELAALASTMSLGELDEGERRYRELLSRGTLSK